MYIYTPLCRYWIALYRYVLVFIVPHVDIELEDNKQFISNIPRMFSGDSEAFLTPTPRHMNLWRHKKFILNPLFYSFVTHGISPYYIGNENDFAY